MRIFLAIDGSECSQTAVAEVSRRPWPTGTKVRLITVHSPMDPGLFRGASPTVFDEIVGQYRKDALERLSAAASVIRKNAPELSVETVLLEGRPKEVIVSEAKKWNADLIVLGSHGSGVFRRLFLGSVSLAVATSAHCSVEIVRCPEDHPGEKPGADQERF